ncbi:hypothetical protein [Novipirellula caenicola]|uniref:Ig-like domain-containing protein n=1 Tax=Novipirellula caenicola TaxID=1536901 RepID=A0ABP9W1G0_9BACT
MDLTTSDWIAVAALGVSVLALIVSIFKDYFTSRNQKIEQSIDRHVQEKMSQAQRRIVELMEKQNSRVETETQQSNRPRVTARYSNKRIHFSNNGNTKAVSVDLTIVEQSGNSPFVDLDTPFDIEPHGHRSFHCTQTSSTIKRPFKIDITWSDEWGRDYEKLGVTIAD